MNLEEMINQEVENKMAFYKKDADNPYSVNGFAGTWAISDYRKIPEVLIGYLQLKFGQLRMRRIPIDDINEALNEIWEGPGSLEHVFRAQAELNASGKDVKFTASDMASIGVKNYEDEDVAPKKSTDPESMSQVPLSNWG